MSLPFAHRKHLQLNAGSFLSATLYAGKDLPLLENLFLKWKGLVVHDEINVQECEHLTPGSSFDKENMIASHLLIGPACKVRCVLRGFDFSFQHLSRVMLPIVGNGQPREYTGFRAR